MSLTDITGRAIDLNTEDGETNTHRAVNSFVDIVAHSARDIQIEAWQVAARKLIHDQATRVMRQVRNSDMRQGSMGNRKSSWMTRRIRFFGMGRLTKYGSPVLETSSKRKTVSPPSRTQNRGLRRLDGSTR